MGMSYKPLSKREESIAKKIIGIEFYYNLWCLCVFVAERLRTVKKINQLN